jgi:hypothetical protein
VCVCERERLVPPSHWDVSQPPSEKLANSVNAFVAVLAKFRLMLVSLLILWTNSTVHSLPPPPLVGGGGGKSDCNGIEG